MTEKIVDWNVKPQYKKKQKKNKQTNSKENSYSTQNRNNHSPYKRPFDIYGCGGGRGVGRGALEDVFWSGIYLIYLFIFFC